MRFKLYEQFNPYDGRALANKFRILAQASPVAKNVSLIRDEDGDYVFWIKTSIPADWKTGNKSFKIIVTKRKDDSKVETYEDSEKVFTSGIEIPSEDNLEVFLLDYLEATNLYDDSSIQTIVDNHDKIQSPSDIRKLIKMELYK